MAQVRIRDRDDLRQWLEGQPREVAVAIAARAAMRTLPALEAWLVRDEEVSISIVLPIFIANNLAFNLFLAGFVNDEQLFSGFDVNSAYAVKSAADAIDIYKFATYVNAVFAAAEAFSNIATASYAVISTATTDTAVKAVNSAVEASAAAADAFYNVVSSNVFSSFIAADTIKASRRASKAARTIWKTIDHDARSLQSRNKMDVSSLIKEPLWPSKMPEALYDSWLSMKECLLARKGEHWEVWTNWYDARLDPSRSIPCYSPPIPELERKRVLLPEEVWKAGPAKANAEIKRLIEEYGCAAERETEDDDVVDERPVIPEQETATIEVEWSEDRLVPKKRPVEADASTLATLQALGQQLQDLTSALRQDSSANAIDPRVVEELEKVARLVPAATPMDESQLIQLAMQVDEVRAYFEGMTEDERLAWPEILRRKLETQLGVLHAFLDQYRTWEKVHGQDGQELSDEEVQAVPDMAEEVAHDLEELGEERVDPQISRVLRDLKARLAEALQMVQRLGHVARERAADLWESINNIAKAIGGWLVRKTKVFGKTLDKEIDEELKILARQLAKWGRRFIFPGGGGWVAYKFGWLQSVLEWLKTVLPSSFM